MKVLIACEYSGIVRDAFVAKGHEAISCDILKTDRPKLHYPDRGSHIQGDVLELLNWDWDLMVAHPPCTYLCNSGVSWLHKKEGRWDKLASGVDFFKALLNADIPKIAIENPIPHKYAVEGIGRKYDQIIQPHQFGHPERKATCFWLKGLPQLQHTNDVKAEMEALPKSKSQRIHWASPSPERGKLRSQTFQGIADAMAEQWS